MMPLQVEKTKDWQEDRSTPTKQGFFHFTPYQFLHLSRTQRLLDKINGVTILKACTWLIFQNVTVRLH